MQRRKESIRVNERIFYNTSKVRVVGPNGNQLGILSPSEALAKAREAGMDLLEVSPSANPPVCRILDYGKYKYEEAKKIKMAKARQHIVKTKEIKFHPKTDANDYSYRLERGKEFIAKGYKLKVTIVFRGRELDHMEYGSRWLKQMEKDLQGIAEPEESAKQAGRSLSTVFVPVKDSLKASKPKTTPDQL